MNHPPDFVSIASDSLLSLGPGDLVQVTSILESVHKSVDILDSKERLRYLKVIFPRWGKFLLSYVAPNFYPLLEDASLFDGFFIHPNIPRACAVEVLCSTLTPDGSQQPSTAATVDALSTEVARLLVQILSVYSLSHFFTSLGHSASPASSALVPLLLRTPGRLNNCLGRACPVFFQADSFGSYVARETVVACSASRGEPAQLLFHCALVEYFAGSIRLRAVTDMWIQVAAEGRVSQAFNWGPLVPSHLTTCFVEALSNSFDRRHGASVAKGAAHLWLERSLEPRAREVPALKSVIVERIILGRRPLGASTLGVFVDIFSNLDILSAVVQSVAEQWSQTFFVEQKEVMVQSSVSRFLVAGLNVMSKPPSSVPLLEGGSLLLALIQGVSQRLHVAVQSIRHDGMRVAKAMSTCLGQPLDFDELCHEDARAVGEEAAMKDAPRLIQPSTLPENAFAVPREGAKQAPNPDEPVDSDESDNESDDDGCTFESGTAFNQSTDSLSALSAHSAEIQVTSFRQFDLSDDLSDLDAVKAPIYLRSCLDLLADDDGSDAVDKHETVLRSIEAIIRSRPADLEEMAQPLAHALLHLEDRFSLDGFQVKKSAALVALCTEATCVVAPVLISAFFDENSSTGTKLEALDFLVGAATDLSGLAVDPSSSDGVEGGLLVDRAGAQGKTSMVKTEGTSSKTKRWGYRRGPAPRLLRNNFYPVATTFFFPLTKALVPGGRRAIFGHPDCSALTAHTLMSLSVFCECARNTPVAATLGRELLECCWPLRSSSDAAVRRAVLAALSVALIYCSDEAPSYVVDALGEFIQMSASSDPDAMCRQGALDLIRTSSLAGLLE